MEWPDQDKSHFVSFTDSSAAGHESLTSMPKVVKVVYLYKMDLMIVLSLDAA